MTDYLCPKRQPTIEDLKIFFLNQSYDKSSSIKSRGSKTLWIYDGKSPYTFVPST